MKKLSDFKDDAAIEVVADLLPYISEIVQNPANKEARGKDAMSFISALLRNNKHAVKGVLAVLNETPVEDYTCTAANILADAVTMLSDPDLLVLFGVQRQTSASAGSASESTEAPAK